MKQSIRLLILVFFLLYQFAISQSYYSYYPTSPSNSNLFLLPADIQNVFRWNDSLSKFNVERDTNIMESVMADRIDEAGALLPEIKNSIDYGSLGLNQTELKLLSDLPESISGQYPETQFVSIGLTALNHFSGKHMILNQAIQSLENIRALNQTKIRIIPRYDSLRKGQYPINFILSCGFSRPVISDFSFEIYPSVGIQIGQLISLHAAIIIRPGHSDFSGWGLAGELPWRRGLTYKLDVGEFEVFHEGYQNHRFYLITGMKKMVRICDRIFSYAFFGYDLSKQMIGDGYADRYRLRVGLDYYLKK